jgi:hypothetical protein
MQYFIMKFILVCIFLNSAFFSFSQTPERYQYNEGPCSATIILYADYTYSYKYACEASSRLSFGKWTKKKDTIKLQAIDPTTYTVIKNVTATTVPGDSIWLTILDKEGRNMTQQISTGLEVTGRGSYMFGLDGSGAKKFVYRRNGGRIVFRTLNKLFGQRLELPTDTANNFVVILNLDSEWISSTHADWDSIHPTILVKKAEALLTMGKTSEQRIFQKQ